MARNRNQNATATGTTATTGTTGTAGRAREVPIDVPAARSGVLHRIKRTSYPDLELEAQGYMQKAWLQEDRSIARWKGGRKATALFPAIGAVISHMRSSMRSGLAEVKHGFGDTSHKVLNRRAFYVRGVPVTQQPAGAGAGTGLMGSALTETVSQLQAVETQTRQPAQVIPGAATTLPVPVQQPIAQPMAQPPVAQQPMMQQPMKQPMMEQPLAAKQAPIQSGQPMQPMQPSSLLSPRGANIGSGMNANLPVYTAQ